VLPKAVRMRRSEDFREAVRTGVRTGRSTLVVHAVTLPAQDDVRVGFVVSKAVGNAVTRNRVKRRLRHLSVQEIPRTPAGTRIVVRALPRAAMTPHELAGDLDRAWGKALSRLSERTRPAADERTPRRRAVL
jgi:ribonuclease P protein component